MRLIWALLLGLWFASFLTASLATVCQQRPTNVASFQCDVDPLQPGSNLYVNGSQTYSIHDREFSVTGTIFVQDQATLDVENATLDLTLPTPSNTSDVLRATDTAQIYITNSTINLRNLGSDNAVTFSCYDQSGIDITGSSFEGQSFYAQAYNDSTLNIENINISATVLPCWTATYGNSSLNMRNSFISGADAYDSSRVYVNNSTLENLDAGFDQGQTTVTIEDSTIWDVSLLSPGKGSCQYAIKNSEIGSYYGIGPNSTAHVTGSSIGSQLITYGNSSVTLEDSTVNWVETYNSSTVTLTRCTWNRITTYGSSKVLVGNWFFGTSFPLVASVPYTWVVPIEIIFIVAVIIVFGASAFAIHAIWLKKKHARDESTRMKQ
jgi:hypothetical protein